MQKSIKIFRYILFVILPFLVVAYFATNGLLYKIGYFDVKPNNDLKNDLKVENNITTTEASYVKIVETSKEFQPTAPQVVEKEPQITQTLDVDTLKNFTIQRASEYGIEPKIIETIIEIESGNNLYAIGVISDNSRSIFDSLNNEENRKYINMKISSNEKFISFLPTSKEVAEQLFDYLNENKEALNIKTMDYGIMQINHDTINGYGLNQKDVFLNPYYNVALGIDVLQTCFKKFPNSQFYTIECYNKGLRQNKLNNLDYYDKFIAQYNKK